MFPVVDLLNKTVPSSDNIFVVGAGLVGRELALWLAQEGKEVTLVEVLNKILAVNGPLCHANFEMLERLMPSYNGIEVLTSAKVVKAT